MDDQNGTIHTVIELGRNVEAQSPFGMKVYENSLSFREMESLVALCDAFLPSIVKADAVNESTAIFYRSSASMAGTPERVGGLVSKRLWHPKKWMIRVVLWLLSSWIGTFIICGIPTLSTKFPYFQNFPQVSQKQREKILLSWSHSIFYHLRMLFKTLKLLVLLVYFSQVDEKNENLTWKAIDYPGPDPDIKQQTLPNALMLPQKEESNDNEREHNEYTDKENLFGPLYNGIVNLNLPLDEVVNSLSLAGFPTHSRGKNSSNSSFPCLVIKTDAVVIGSGSGGGVVAGVLANAGHKVVVLEKGQYYARTNLSLLEGPSMDQMYQSAGLVATDDLGVTILSGSTIGGGSTINWSASIRTPHHVISEWSESYDLELFDSPMYKEAMDVVCKKMGVQSEVNDEGFNNAVLRKGCEEMGYPVSTIPRNSAADHYCGWCCFGCKNGRKKGISETWLVDVVNSGNGVILPGCEAIKVLHKQRKNRKFATGVVFSFQNYRGEKQCCLVESKVTVVACGALNTPPLLKASGLKNANIGKNLHLHPVAMAWGYFPDEPNSWPEYKRKSYEGGIMTSMSTVVANFENSGYGALIQTPSLHPGMFASVMPWISGSDMKTRMSKFSRTAHLLALGRDKGSGTVNSPNDISYRMEAIDEENLQKGLDKMLRILTAAGAEEIGAHHNRGRRLNVKKASYREFDKFVVEESSVALRDLSSQIFSAHQMGSCRMGIDPKDSVVDQTGETWEVEGLFVADSSVFPTALGVNPMLTVQAIAYCTSQSILGLLRRKKLTSS